VRPVSLDLLHLIPSHLWSLSQNLWRKHRFFSLAYFDLLAPITPPRLTPRLGSRCGDFDAFLPTGQRSSGFQAFCPCQMKMKGCQLCMSLSHCRPHSARPPWTTGAHSCACVCKFVLAPTCVHWSPEQACASRARRKRKTARQGITYQRAAAPEAADPRSGAAPEDAAPRSGAAPEDAAPRSGAWSPICCMTRRTQNTRGGIRKLASTPRWASCRDEKKTGKSPVHFSPPSSLALSAHADETFADKSA